MEKTKFEKDYGVNLESPNLDVVKAVEVGISVEKAGEEFYFKHAKTAKTPGLRQFLEFLGKQEIEHFNLLTQLKAGLQKRGHWLKTTESLEKPEIFKTGKSPKVTKESSDIEVLMHALDVEKQTRDYYRKFAENISDPTGRHFFSKLADFEQGHADMIEAMADIRAESHIET